MKTEEYAFPLYEQLFKKNEQSACGKKKNRNVMKSEAGDVTDLLVLDRFSLQ